MFYAANASAQEQIVSESDPTDVQTAEAVEQTEVAAEQTEVAAEQTEVAAEQTEVAAEQTEVSNDAIVQPLPADVQTAGDPVSVQPQAGYTVTVVESPVSPDQPILNTVDSRNVANDQIWGKGFGLFVGIGPAVDLRDPAVGYSSRIGINVHGDYWGLGFEVTWNTVWLAEPAKRIDNQDAAYKVTNSGLLLSLDGYAPINNHFVFRGGAAIGVGRRYETIFSDYPNLEESGSSWLTRFRAGAFYLFDSHFTVGLDLELNLGNYTDEDYRWWSDCEMDVSLGVILHASYQFLNW